MGAERCRSADGDMAQNGIMTVSLPCHKFANLDAELQDPRYIRSVPCQFFVAL